MNYSKIAGAMLFSGNGAKLKELYSEVENNPMFAEMKKVINSNDILSESFLDFVIKDPNSAEKVLDVMKANPDIIERIPDALRRLQSDLAGLDSDAQESSYRKIFEGFIQLNDGDIETNLRLFTGTSEPTRTTELDNTSNQSTALADNPKKDTPKNNFLAKVEEAGIKDPGPAKEVDPVTFLTDLQKKISDSDDMQPWIKAQLTSQMGNIIYEIQNLMPELMPAIKRLFEEKINEITENIKNSDNLAIFTSNNGKLAATVVDPEQEVALIKKDSPQVSHVKGSDLGDKHSIEKEEPQQQPQHVAANNTQAPEVPSLDPASTTGTF